MKINKLLSFGFILLLVSCTSSYNSKYTKDSYGIKKAPKVYTVKKGDSLFAIAWQYGLEQKEIQQNNSIANPNKIFVGQKLKLIASKKSNKPLASSKKTNKEVTNKKPKNKKPSSSYSRVSKSWVWPMKGRIVRNYNPSQVGSNGLRISGRPNQTINAAEGGVVAYQGSGLNGYGNVVIIKHKSGLLSAYGYLSKAHVKEGQKIKKRQKIGTVGFANSKDLMLHFEVRKNGKPVNPKSYIGSSYRF